ncbi:hypothetical protein G5V59_12205 [Nocardioides sp. W3-2-3]|uniref:hypothetical protein n=1 Tax=Nocardioides convexus TaxID=2712224 RepID=UPI00241827F4|nr:hypothetical protein [Nocardioides convexus]NHA00531.1 hypothetical protein [Nocardioides convexus]
MTSNARLTAATAALIAAVLLAPSLVARLLVPGYDGVGALRDGLPGAFAADGTLDRSADWWAAFHGTKAALAALLLVVLVAALRRSRGVARGAVVGLAGLALVVVLANLQGMVAPVSSLLSMLPGDAARTVLATDGTPGFAGLVDDFATYHLAMVVLAGIAALGLAVVAVRTRRWVPATAAVVLLVVTYANITTVADPGPALRAFLAAQP